MQLFLGYTRGPPFSAGIQNPHTVGPPLNFLAARLVPADHFIADGDIQRQISKLTHVVLCIFALVLTFSEIFTFQMFDIRNIGHAVIVRYSLYKMYNVGLSNV